MTLPALSSVGGALRTLIALHDVVEGGVSELARATGLPKSVVHRNLSTLKAEQFVTQDPRSRKYKVGPMAYAVGQTFLVHNDLYTATIACLEGDLRDHTSFVGYLDGYETITVAAREGSGPVVVRPTGSRAYAHTTAVGKVMAAALSDEEIERRFKGWSFPKVTPYTIGTYERWLKELELTRRRGYAVIHEELDLGVASIGAPLRDPTGVIAGVSIAYGIGTVKPESEAALGELLMESASKVTARLGGLVPVDSGAKYLEDRRGAAVENRRQRPRAARQHPNRPTQADHRRY